MKRKISKPALMAIFICLTMGMVTSIWASEPAGRYDTKPIRLQMGDYEYLIPKNHIDSQARGAPEMQCNQNTLSLDYLLPNWEGYTPENYRALRYVFGRESRDINVFLEKPIKTASEMLQITYDIKFNSSHVYEYPLKEKVYGLTFYKPVFPYEGAASSRKSFFVNRAKDGALISFLTCSEHGTVPTPICLHYFTHNGVVIKTRYSRHMLYRWDEFETKIKKFLTHYTVGKAEKRLPKCDY